MTQSRPRLLFTVGDVNGIGPEVLIKALRRSIRDEQFSATVIGNARLLAEHVQALGLNDVKISDTAITVADREHELIPLESDATFTPGNIDPLAGKLAGDAITRSITMLNDGQGDAVVTMPISKHALNLGGYQWPGHTEMIAHLSGGASPLMILLTSGLRVALATIHVPVSSVPSLLNPDLIRERYGTLHQTLIRDFGIPSPRIAVLGLNPHAGEDGTIGTEEQEYIAPLTEQLRTEGFQAEGPFPADGFFARYRADDYDGVLAMYHDQGLIPLKMFARGGGVNVTAGLPIVRTSPDHGTAFPIAGRGIADETSVMEAIHCALTIVENRSRTEAEPDQS